MRLRSGRLVGMALVLAALGLQPATAATTDTLRFAGCLASAGGVSGCPDVSSGIAGGGQPAMAPDGSQLYVPGPDDATLVAYDVDGGGGLSRAACVNNSGNGGCLQIDGLDRPWAAA